MSWWEILLIVASCAFVVTVVVYNIIRKKKGKGGCGCGCSGCSGCNGCSSKEQKK